MGERGGHDRKRAGAAPTARAIGGMRTTAHARQVTSTTSRRVFHLAAMALVIAATYSGSLSGTFVSDDTVEVANKPMIRSLDVHHVREMLTTFDGANYMPITVLSFAANYRLTGPKPLGFHLGNILLHTACALLVYALLLRLELQPHLACITALLWAVHPLQVESVAWISERKNVLSGAFFFAAFYFYVLFSQRPRLRTYVALLVLFVLAVLAKMNTMVLPAVALAYETAFRFRLRARDVLAALPMVGIAAGVAWYNVAGNPIHGGDYHGGSALVTWLSSCVVVFRYLRNLLLPIDLSVFYDVPLRGSLLDLPVLLSVLGLAGLAVAVVFSVSIKRREGFWILWFAITLAPMLNIVPFRSMMNDRYMYLALLGPLALVTSAAAALVRLRRLRIPLVVGAAAAIAACASLTFRRVDIWASPLALWKDWALRVPYSAADPVYRQEDLDAKVAYLRQASQREPSLAIARNNLGALYFESGSFGEAVQELEAARKLAPDQPAILYNLGRAYAYAGRLPDAKAVLERAAALDPYAFQTQLILGRVCRILGDAENARRAYEACARIQPTHFNSSPYFKRDRDFLRAVQASEGEPAGG
jgi:cytochrome c-type biogenesis protein CcmH/NrfG